MELVNSRKFTQISVTLSGHAKTQQPRPESYHEDLETARTSSNPHITKSKLYTHIATAAESGYDFSSRWMQNPHDLSTIQTAQIIPVDLNAILYKNELILADLMSLNDDTKSSLKYRKLAAKRRLAMNKLMWSQSMQCWLDFNMRTGQLNSKFYISNLSPLWMGLMPPKSISFAQIMAKYEPVLERFECGVPVSMCASGQQWDYHNVWAPNQHSMIIMLLEYDREAALKLARNFFSTVYHGWIQTGSIFEKYDVRQIGKRGHGGEYEVQSGFGWTNGCILGLIHLFGDELVTVNSS